MSDHEAALAEFAAETLPFAEMRAASIAPLERTWAEPLDDGTLRSTLSILYRAADIHDRVMAMARQFFDRTQWGELCYMVSQTLGDGRQREPTFTIAEGQAMMVNPFFKARMEAINAHVFYDYVYSIDWAAHWLDHIERMIDQIKAPVDMESSVKHEQLDNVLLAPHDVPWWMYDESDIRKEIQKGSWVYKNADRSKPDEVRKSKLGFLASTWLSDVLPMHYQVDWDAPTKQGKLYVGLLVSKKSLADMAQHSIAFHGDYILAACQEAILLSLPLWNDIVALSQGLFRVTLTQANSLFGNKSPVQTGAWINAAPATQFYLLPARGPEERKEDVASNKMFAFVPRTSNNTKAAGLPSSTSLLDADGIFTGAGMYKNSAGTSMTATKTLSDWKGDEEFKQFVVNMDDVSAALVLQPSVLSPLLVHLSGYPRMLPPWMDDAKYKGKKLYELVPLLKSELAHNGAGGAIPKYAYNGAVPVPGGQAFFAGVSDATNFTPVVKTSAVLTDVMRSLAPHPISKCPDLREKMEATIMLDSSERKRMMHDTGYRPSPGTRSRNIVQFLVSRMRDLQQKYAAVRRPDVAKRQPHNMATTEGIMLTDWSPPAPRDPAARNPKMCPPNTIPMMFDSIANKPLSTDEWQRLTVNVNGEQLLPSHIKVQACLPARPVTDTRVPTLAEIGI